MDVVKRVATFVPKLFVDYVGHENGIVDSATGIFHGAGERSIRRLIAEVVQRSPALISTELLLETVKKVSTTVLRAVIAKVGKLHIIKDGVFSNDINSATLGLIWNNGAGLAKFLVDLVEPAKCYVAADSIDGVARQDNPHGRYNELDLSTAMNRHAAICQFQRLIQSMIFLLKQVSTTVDVEKLKDVGMTDATTLRSDVDSGTVIVASPAKEGAEESAEKPPEKPKVTNEKWLFVNGIAGELCWLRLACDRLANHFSREITGVFNRGDGILWDLIECAGERTAQGEGIAKKQKRLIERTKSSSMAQKSLKEELIQALKTPAKHVVMIAHSQGCLLLRLVLEEILNDSLHTGDLAIRKAMLVRLCVFTFGNPSIDWKWEKKISHEDNIDQKVTDPTQLSLYVLRTEHFANEADFVTKLGVLSDKMLENRGYAPGRLFINKKEDWIGHLFGTQYSLDSNDYTGTEGELNGQTSWLLACRDGRSIEDVSKEMFRGKS